MEKNETQVTRLALVGFPFDRNSSFLRGAAEAPPLIRQALTSSSTNAWSEDGVNTGRPGLIHDAGDIAPSVPDPEFAIEQATMDLMGRGFTPICLGGDHSITYPIVKAMARRYQPLTIVHFDAHSDTYTIFQDNPLSHACPFARIMEQGLASRLIQVGVRTLTEEHRYQVHRFAVDLIEMKDWPDRMQLRVEGAVYLSVDIDVLDPAFAPGVSHYEPGGCSTRQLLQAIRGLQGRFVGGDIVEYNPLRDLNGITAMVCAKILKEMAAAFVSDRLDSS